jgi:hypothetical protein
MALGQLDSHRHKKIALIKSPRSGGDFLYDIENIMIDFDGKWI